MSSDSIDPILHKPQKDFSPLVSLLHTFSLLGVLGIWFYTEFFFQRPKFTEIEERKILFQEIHHLKEENVKPEYLEIGPLTVPIAASKTSQKKTHSLTLEIALEIQNPNLLPECQTWTPLILDEINSILSEKYFHELNHPYGKYALGLQLTDAINQLMEKKLNLFLPDGLFSELFFNQFLLI